METIFAADAVSFAYPAGELALRELSLGFRRGGRTALLGDNGSGKSTLFALLGGFLRPATGRIMFCGQPLSYDRRNLADLRRRVGFLFQEPDHQLFSASLYEDVSFGPLNLGLTEVEVRRRVEAAIDRVGLAPLVERPVHALSHGQKKRACLAGIFAMQPQVLILDEPTAGLDPESISALLQLLDDFQSGGGTVILATQDVDFAYAWAEEICILDGGQLSFQGDISAYEDLLRQPPSMASIPQTPWVFTITRTLMSEGYLQPTDGMPRNRDALMTLLAQCSRS